MADVTLSLFEYRGGKHVKIVFPYNQELRDYIKNFPNVRWSRTHDSYYIPYSKRKVNELFLYLRARNLYVDYSGLKAGVYKKNLIKEGNTTLANLSKASIQAIDQFSEWMEQKRYSENTIKTYSSMIKLFLGHHCRKKMEDLDKDDLSRFNTDYILANNYSATYQNQLVNALKLFYSRITDHRMQIEQLERPRKSQRLPEVLSLEEVKELLGTIQNTKHKTLLCLLYSCGLRIGESLNLKLSDIDFKRNLVHIKSGKGHKDRYIPLSSTMKSLLQRYYTQYKPVLFVFEGQSKDTYSPVSARQVLKRALSKTRIKKQVTLHTLRHSYATHLLENGTDIRFIQELLGHNDPKTTMIYTHVSTTSLEKIKNPFDDFNI